MLDPLDLCNVYRQMAFFLKILSEQRPILTLLSKKSLKDMDFEEKVTEMRIWPLIYFWRFENLKKQLKKGKKVTEKQGKNGEKGNTIDRKARKLDLLKLRNINKFKQT